MRRLRLLLFISCSLVLALLLPGLFFGPADRLADNCCGDTARYLAEQNLSRQAKLESQQQARERAALRQQQAAALAEQVEQQRLAQEQEQHYLETNDGAVRIERPQSRGADFFRESRQYSLPNGDFFYQQRLSYSMAAQPRQLVAATILLQGGAGTMRRYVPESGQWQINELAEGVYDNHMYFIETEQQSMIVMPTLSYLARENDMLEAVPDHSGTMELRLYQGGWLIVLYAPVLPGGSGEYFYLLSQGQLLDWEGNDGAASWASYDFSRENRWCYDGYYYEAPYNYIPSGENYFYRLPAAFIAADLAFNQNRAAADLSLCMLDVMLELQNEDGWFPTIAGSEWLLNDYQIGPGFYDTRFNSDLMKSLLHLAIERETPHFAAAALDYGAWYLRMARGHHFTLYDENNNPGWLVFDYFHPDGQLPTHCSLNHQLAQIIVLFYLYDLSGDPQYEQTAWKMINGVNIVGSDWIKNNGSLHYAYLPDGSCGLDDYLYLTYNDLYELQNMLVQRYGEPDPGLAELLATKLAWMKRNRVTGYSGWEP